MNTLEDLGFKQIDYNTDEAIGMALIERMRTVIISKSDAYEKELRNYSEIVCINTSKYENLNIDDLVKVAIRMRPELIIIDMPEKDRKSVV